MALDTLVARALERYDPDCEPTAEAYETLDGHTLLVDADGDYDPVRDGHPSTLDVPWLSGPGVDLAEVR